MNLSNSKQNLKSIDFINCYINHNFNFIDYYTNYYIDFGYFVNSYCYIDFIIQ